MAARRDVGPFLRQVREFLLGRKHTVALRFEDGLAPRDQPPPNIPGGPAHKLSANLYVSRDARRSVQPPINVVKQALIADGNAAAPAPRKPTPGKIFNWD